MSNQNKSALDCAGAALLKIVIRQAQIAQKSSKTELNCTDIKTLLEKARQSLSEADPTEHPHKFLATKTALEVIEAIERGGAHPRGHQNIQKLGGIHKWRPTRLGFWW